MGLIERSMCIAENTKDFVYCLPIQFRADLFVCCLPVLSSADYFVYCINLFLNLVQQIILCTASSIVSHADCYVYCLNLSSLFRADYFVYCLPSCQVHLLFFFITCLEFGLLILCSFVVQNFVYCFRMFSHPVLWRLFCGLSPLAVHAVRTILRFV